MKTTISHLIWEFLGTIFSSKFLPLSLLSGTSTVSVSLLYGVQEGSEYVSFCSLIFLFATQTEQFLLMHLCICSLFVFLAKICYCAPLVILFYFFCNFQL